MTEHFIDLDSVGEPKLNDVIDSEVYRYLTKMIDDINFNFASDVEKIRRSPKSLEWQHGQIRQLDINRIRKMDAIGCEMKKLFDSCYVIRIIHEDN